MFKMRQNFLKVPIEKSRVYYSFIISSYLMEILFREHLLAHLMF